MLTFDWMWLGGHGHFTSLPSSNTSKQQGRTSGHEVKCVHLLLAGRESRHVPTAHITTCMYMLCSHCSSLRSHPESVIGMILVCSAAISLNSSRFEGVWFYNVSGRVFGLHSLFCGGRDNSVLLLWKAGQRSDRLIVAHEELNLCDEQHHHSNTLQRKNDNTQMYVIQGRKSD